MNYLETATGGLNSSVPGWYNYWQNQYNTLDTDMESKVVARMADKIVREYLGQLPCHVKIMGPGVEEVTTLIINNTLKGSIIQFHTDHGVMELLVKPHQQLRIVNGNKITRVITFFQVGSGYDNKEKIFRNKFGAFGTESELSLVIKFNKATAAAFLVDLTYRY